MPALPHYFVRLNGERRGPFAAGQLRELAEAGVITAQTEAAVDATGPWLPVADHPELAGILPKRRPFQFKARAFESVNRPEAPPVDHRDLIAAAHRGAKPAAAASAPAVPPDGDVRQIVRENTRVQLQHEKPVDLTPPPNRRRRDYLILMTIVTGLFVVALILGGLSVFAVSGIVLASVGITWVMFGVMDRY